MPLVMRVAIAVDINLATFQKIDLFKVPCPSLVCVAERLFFCKKKKCKVLLFFN